MLDAEGATTVITRVADPVGYANGSPAAGGADVGFAVVGTAEWISLLSGAEDAREEP
ncbi:MAG: hypothetical protein ABI808_04270 [Pseudonocardiales bacterium]